MDLNSYTDDELLELAQKAQKEVQTRKIKRERETQQKHARRSFQLMSWISLHRGKTIQVVLHNGRVGVLRGWRKTFWGYGVGIEFEGERTWGWDPATIKTLLVRE